MTNKALLRLVCLFLMLAGRAPSVSSRASAAAPAPAPDAHDALVYKRYPCGEFEAEIQNKLPKEDFGLDGITVRLQWAPFDPRNPSPDYPNEDDYIDVPGRYVTHEPRGTGLSERSLETGQTVRVFSADLRELFDIRKPGHYQYWYEIAPESLGLPNGPPEGASSCRVGFKLGKQPKKLTLAQLNAEIGMLGGRGVEERLRKMIEAGFKKVPPDVPGARPLPADYPALARRGFMGGNMSGMESEVTQLAIANEKPLAELREYSASSVRREFEKRMLEEKRSPAMKLLCASVAAQAGSRKAAEHVLESMKSTEYDTVRNTQSAIRDVLYGLYADGGTGPPDWAVKLALAAATDKRYVTGLEEAHWASGTLLHISDVADDYEDLTGTLGIIRCRQAVPVLIEKVKQSDAGRRYVWALGATGDPRAVPVLLEYLKRHIAKAEWKESFGLDESTDRLIGAVASLKVKEAVPVLIDHVEFPEAIEALETIGDARALPVLRDLVKAKGTIRRDGGPLTPFLDQPRLGAARIALASLEPGDPVPRLVALLGDQTLGEFQRREVVWRLRAKPDRRAVQSLVHAIQNDPSGSVVNQAIGALSDFPFPETVDGLVTCFDARFDGKSDWKRAYNPEMFRANIAASLQAVTGKELPADKAAWQAWWKANRASFRPPVRPRKSQAHGVCLPGGRTAHGVCLLLTARHGGRRLLGPGP